MKQWPITFVQNKALETNSIHNFLGHKHTHDSEKYVMNLFFMQDKKKGLSSKALQLV